MGENEANRLVQTEKPLLVFHNQVISIYIIRSIFPAIMDCTVFKAIASFVDGKIPGVGTADLDSIEVLHVVVLAKLQLPFTQHILVLFFKDLSILTIHRRTGFIVLAILGYLVNEEQRKDLDPLKEQLSFALKMRLDRLSNLNPPNMLFIHCTDHVSS